MIARSIHETRFPEETVFLSGCGEGDEITTLFAKPLETGKKTEKKLLDVFSRD